jgi:DNA-directed RNA polymerase subunit RPC12/RpoP
MMVKIQCTNCGTDGYMSLLNSTYQMSYRCWKCKEYFTLTVEDNAVKSLVKLSPEEYQKVKEAEDLKSKFKRQF